MPLALSFSLAPLASCTPERRHAVLTFWFDGVPPLHAVPETAEVSPQYFGEGRRSVGLPRAKKEYHPPYQAKRCEDCHPRKMSFFLGEDFDRRGRCFSCHQHEPFKETLDQLALLHGPVAVGSCLVCHDPHESIYPPLLVAPDPKLCYGCHERNAILSSPAHAERDEKTCLPCHDPHGGNQPFFLRDEGER